MITFYFIAARCEAEYSLEKQDFVSAKILIGKTLPKETTIGFAPPLEIIALLLQNWQCKTKEKKDNNKSVIG